MNRVRAKYLVWAAGLAFALAIAFPIFSIAGLGRLGPSGWSDTLSEALAAFAIGLGSQLGLLLAPVVRQRGAAFRLSATGLMAPAFVLGLASYRDLFWRVRDLGVRILEQPLFFLYPAIVPVYVAVALWIWRAPRGAAAQSAA